jgi:prepilin-type N-terminal cleavage/methylation domain-containing protein
MRKIGSHSNGFSLIETSVVLLIFGIVLGAIISIVPTLHQKDTISDMNNKFDTIQKAIDTFYSQNGYLPCPARITAAPNTVNFGVATDCSLATVADTVEVAGTTANENLRIGVVPTRTLNLPDEYMFDSYNTRIEYVSVKQMSISNALFAPYVSAQPDVIRIEDAGANRIHQANSGTYANVVAYAIMSAGPNNKGAVNYLGTVNPIVACSGGRDAENCDNDNTFVDTSYNTDTTNYYDDYIRWKTKQQIMREVTYSAGGGSGSSTPPGLSLLFTADYTSAVDVSFLTRRPLNTVKYNNIPGASLNTSTFVMTLPAGKYLVKAKARTWNFGDHILQLYNDTTSTELVRSNFISGISSSGWAYGGSCWFRSGGGIEGFMSDMEGGFTLAATSQVSLRTVIDPYIIGGTPKCVPTAPHYQPAHFSSGDLTWQGIVSVFGRVTHATVEIIQQ